MYAILQVKHIEKEDAVRGTLQSQIVDVSSARFVVTQPKAAMQREREREREREKKKRGFPPRALMLHSKLRRTFLLSIFIVLALRVRR